MVFEKSAPHWESLPSGRTNSETLSKAEFNSWFYRDYLQANNIRTWNLNEPTERIQIRRHLGPSPQLLQANAHYQRSLFTTEMFTRALQRRRLTAELEDRLCFYYFDKNPVQTISFKARLLPWQSSDHWLKKCLQSVDRSKTSFFRAQLETPIDRIDDVQFLGTTTSSLSVGTSFSVTSSESKTNSTSMSAAAQIGLSNKFSELFSIGGTATYTMSRGESEAQSNSNGLSVSTGVGLNVRKLSLKVKGTHSQKCVIAQIDPAFYKNLNSPLYKDVLDATVSRTKTVQFLTQKIRLCHAEQEAVPFESQEEFYFVTQDTLGTSFIDDPDLRNRPLLLQLRGNPAYQNFIRYIGANISAPDQTNNIDEQALTTVEKTTKAMQMAVPTFPGLMAETLGR
jgi:hypothetical protein